jgi:hypothetical protein
MQLDPLKFGFHFFQAWKLWIEDKPMELIDELVSNSCTLFSVLRYIHVGLLCVQQRLEDRPNMSTVVQMLTSRWIKKFKIFFSCLYTYTLMSLKQCNG